MKSSDSRLENTTVLAFESRLADTTATLLQRQGARAFSAPSMQEVPLESHSAVFTLADELFSGEIDILICLTGVGTDLMIKTMETKYDTKKVHDALNGITIVSRGPKPRKVLRERDISIDINVPEPNTWKEILGVMEGHSLTADLNGKRIAIQEYGESNEMLYGELRKRGAELLQTPIYRWELPDDLEPLKKGIRAVLDHEIQIVLFTSKTQSNNVISVADMMGVKDAFIKTLNETVMVASIGPVCTTGLQEQGIDVDFEPSRPKLAIFVKEVAEAFRAT